ncbi:MAG: hydroxymethylbilane synthase [Alphaproteobacteria bacterium]
MEASILKLSARKSPLSLAQASWVQAELRAASIDACIIPFTTTGDKILDKPLAEVGGKGLFTKEIEEALLRGDIDVAVHSFKDMPTELPDGLIIASIPKREDVRDAWIAKNTAWKTPEHLPANGVVGTSSLRRRVQLQHAFPSLRVESVRGNVGTRLEKLRAGNVDALVLSLVGFQRLQLVDRITHVFPPHEMIPAVAQGALALECREDRLDVISQLQSLHHTPTALCIEIERAFLKALDGSCRTPIGGYARFEGDVVVFEGLLGTLDAQVVSRVRTIYDPAGTSFSPETFGKQQAKNLLELHHQRCKEKVACHPLPCL